MTLYADFDSALEGVTPRPTKQFRFADDARGDLPPLNCGVLTMDELRAPPSYPESPHWSEDNVLDLDMSCEDIDFSTFEF